MAINPVNPNSQQIANLYKSNQLQYAAPQRTVATPTLPAQVARNINYSEFAQFPDTLANNEYLRIDQGYVNAGAANIPNNTLQLTGSNSTAIIRGSSSNKNDVSISAARPFSIGPDGAQIAGAVPTNNATFVHTDQESYADGYPSAAPYVGADDTVSINMSDASQAVTRPNDAPVTDPLTTTYGANNLQVVNTFRGNDKVSLQSWDSANGPMIDMNRNTAILNLGAGDDLVDTKLPGNSVTQLQNMDVVINGDGNNIAPGVGIGTASQYPAWDDSAEVQGADTIDLRRKYFDLTTGSGVDSATAVRNNKFVINGGTVKYTPVTDPTTGAPVLNADGTPKLTGVARDVNLPGQTDKVYLPVAGAGLIKSAITDAAGVAYTRYTDTANNNTFDLNGIEQVFDQNGALVP